MTAMSKPRRPQAPGNEAVDEVFRQLGLESSAKRETLRQWAAAENGDDVQIQIQLAGNAGPTKDE